MEGLPWKSPPSVQMIEAQDYYHFSKGSLSDPELKKSEVSGGNRRGIGKGRENMCAKHMREHSLCLSLSLSLTS